VLRLVLGLFLGLLAGFEDHADLVGGHAAVEHVLLQGAGNLVPSIFVPIVADN
jgi:hypothetical protein